MDVKLIMFKSDGQRKDFPIINPVTVIGRGENCDLQVPLLNVSRRHCELSLSGNVVKIKDLASSNGTFVNNKRVNETILNPGDRLVVGPVVFTLQIDGQPEDIKPIKTKPPVAEGGDEEVVELEADVIAQPGASALEEGPVDLAEVGVQEEGEEEEEEIDVISALEKMANEDKKKKKQ